MCRLMGLTAGSERVRATFWLLEAFDSLVRQSQTNPDGTGLGTFDASGRPVVEKQPLAAYEDRAFAAEARERVSSTFVAHVRLATGTPVTRANTHPFTLDGRIFAHHGVIGDLPRLEAHLDDDLALVRGDTDSERLFALVTREIVRAGGDVTAGISTAVGWTVDHLPVTSANFVLTSEHELWALRLPGFHEMWVLERPAPDSVLDHHSALGSRVVSDHLASVPSVVVASERLDDDPAWRLLEPGVLLHVDAGLRLARTRLVG